MTAEKGIRLESVSMGKGIVRWRVQFPPLARRDRNIRREYGDLMEAIGDVKRFCERAQVAEGTARLIEEKLPDGKWGSDRAGG
ncbi:MAG: hypothetical protein ACE5GW_13250 [Planctomycetota bacterium]